MRSINGHAGQVVIAGICRENDLVEPLLEALEARSPAHAKRVAEAYSEVLRLRESDEEIDPIWIHWLIEDLRERLDFLAPEGQFFGSPRSIGGECILGFFPRGM